MNDALGLIEIKGLAGAITIADAMVKTANVELLGIEKAKGFGWTTIKIIGDVGAVTAAVSTGQALALQHDQFVTAKVIPRPSQSVGQVFCAPHIKKEEPTPDPEPEPQAEPEPILEPEPEQPSAEVLVVEADLVQELEAAPEEATAEPEPALLEVAEPEEAPVPVVEEIEAPLLLTPAAPEEKAPAAKPAKAPRSGGKGQRNKSKTANQARIELPEEGSR